MDCDFNAILSRVKGLQAEAVVLLMFFYENPGARGEEIYANLDLSVVDVSHFLIELEQRGLIKKVGNGIYPR